MDDAEFLRAFEDHTLPGSAFHHRDHVRLAWLYLRRCPPLEALARFTEGLKRFAAANGSPGLYHETITWAYLFLIRERMAEGEAFEGFAARNPDLLAWKPSGSSSTSSSPAEAGKPLASSCKRARMPLSSSTTPRSASWVSVSVSVIGFLSPLSSCNLSTGPRHLESRECVMPSGGLFLRRRV